MADGEVTMPDLLKKKGYDTHMIGKVPNSSWLLLLIAELLVVQQWHLGHNEPYSPTFRGFDTYYGLPFSGDMGCIDSTPQGCKPEYNRSISQPACPALCAPESSTNPAATVGIPLYDSAGQNCTHHTSCNEDIVTQPFNPMSLNTQYASRAKSIFSQYSSSANPNPFLLYMAFAHTHTPLGYDEARFGNASPRPGWEKVFGNTLAEVDSAVGEVHKALEEQGLAEDTLIILTADKYELPSERCCLCVIVCMPQWPRRPGERRL